MAIVNFLPQNPAAFRNVFLINGSVAEQAEYKRQSARLNALGRSTTTDIEVALRGKSDLIIIVGHNDGNFLKAPDGTEVGLEFLARKCEALGKICMFLSCDAAKKVAPNKFAFARSIKPDEAVSVAEKIVSEMNQAYRNADGSLSNPEATLANVLITFSPGYIAKIYIRRAVGGTPILLVVLLLRCDEEDSCPTN